MRHSHLSRPLVLALVAGTVLAVAADPARADTPTPLYVDNTVSTCSDSGTGTQAVPYCTVSAGVAAVTAGGTLYLNGTFNEHVTIAKSGSLGSPITIEPMTGKAAKLYGAAAQLTIAGQHDISLVKFSVYNSGSAPAANVSNSTRIQFANSGFTSIGYTGAAVSLTGVTNSTFAITRLTNQYGSAGVLLDAATSGVTIKGGIFNGYPTAGVTVDIAGSGNTLVDTYFGGGSGAGVRLEPNASGNVVADNYLADTGLGGNGGIVNDGASGTAITNNTVANICGDGITVSGASSAVSVQNNLVESTTPDSHCPVSSGADIALSGAAASSTTVDYNVVRDFLSARYEYALNGTAMPLASFRNASGQAAHDQDTGIGIDSANSSAPGYQATDRQGRAREDDPAVANTGAGPITYADRGCDEEIEGPNPHLAATVDSAGYATTADASATTAGFEPIVSYTFDFGDGYTVTQASPKAAHTYASHGGYTVTVTVTDSFGIYSTTTAYAAAWPLAGTIALLSVANDRYVDGTPGATADGTSVGTAELFDMLSITGTEVALRARSSYLFLLMDATDGDVYVEATVADSSVTEFQIVTNSDGTVSLKTTDGHYISVGPSGAMTCTATTVTSAEEYHTVQPNNASVSFRAHANNLYVTAENGGASSLIANRSAVGFWETFDIVDAGGGFVALYSHADDKFVTAENAGALPLIANRTAIGAWEKFTVVTNSDGSITLLANANGKYVTAENGGASPLIANRTAIGYWEKFDRVAG